jgi:choline kinase
VPTIPDFPECLGLFVLGTFIVKNNVIAIVLAAGQGKRMESSLPKVAHLLLEKPLLIWVMESLVSAGIQSILPIIAPSQTLVKEIIQKSNISQNVKINYDTFCLFAPQTKDNIFIIFKPKINKLL